MQYDDTMVPCGSTVMIRRKPLPREVRVPDENPWGDGSRPVMELMSVVAEVRRTHKAKDDLLTLALLENRVRAEGGLSCIEDAWQEVLDRWAWMLTVVEGE